MNSSCHCVITIVAEEITFQHQNRVMSCTGILEAEVYILGAYSRGTHLFIYAVKQFHGMCGVGSVYNEICGRTHA